MLPAYGWWVASGTAKKRGEEGRHGLSEGLAFVTRRGKRKRDGISTRLFFFLEVDATGKNQSKSAK